MHRLLSFRKTETKLQCFKENGALIQFGDHKTVGRAGEGKGRKQVLAFSFTTTVTAL